MKFGAVLRDSAAELPDTEDLFLKYKQLKKSLKRMHATQNAAQPHHSNSEDDSDHANAEAGPSAKRIKHSNPEHQPNKEEEYHQKHEEDEDKRDATATILLDPELEAEFLRVITADVMELNDRYMEKEEDNVIKFSQLEDAAEAASTFEARAALYRAFVDLHGELLMFFHWSVLAYTGLVKILKKHRKRTGAPLHAPHLENLLSQPFCSVEVTCDMVRKAEEWVSKLAIDLDVAPPPAVPLPEGLLKQSTTSAAAAGAGTVAAGLNVGGVGSETLVSSEEKAKVLEAVAAAVAVAAAAEEKEEEAQAALFPAGNAYNTNINIENSIVEAKGKEETKKKTSTGPEGVAAVAVAATGSAQENIALRRIRAALNVWQQLHSNVSTPSTMIAPAVGGAGSAGVGVGVAPPASLTTSSIA